MKICPQCGKRYQGSETTCTVDGARLSSLADDPYIGYQLANYQLQERIGRGGFGVVYLAKHNTLNNLVAVKILKKQYSSDEQLVQRFRREARVSSQMNHENVVHIVDFGYDNEIGFYYIMEYLDGQSLTEVMKAYPKGMPIQRLLPIMRQICSALEQAHSLSVVHRDLKPSNIFLVDRFSQEDVVKILDFGIAKVLQGEEGKGMTVTGQIVGSPRFMSPEQARGRHSEVDPRSDIYSLGVILFWTLTGRLPFESKQLARLLYMHVKMAPPKLGEVNPHRSYAVALEAVVQSALSKRKSDRPTNASELYRRLEMACEEQPQVGGMYREMLNPSHAEQTVQSDSMALHGHGAGVSVAQIASHQSSPHILHYPPPASRSGIPVQLPSSIEDDPLDSTQIDARHSASHGSLDVILQDEIDESTVHLTEQGIDQDSLTSSLASTGAEDITSTEPPMPPLDDLIKTSPNPPLEKKSFPWKIILLVLLFLVLLFELAFVGWKLWKKRQKGQSLSPPRIEGSRWATQDSPRHQPPSTTYRERKIRWKVKS